MCEANTSPSMSAQLTSKQTVPRPWFKEIGALAAQARSGARFFVLSGFEAVIQRRLTLPHAHGLPPTGDFAGELLYRTRRFGVRKEVGAKEGLPRRLRFSV